jgi:cell division protein FtsQ
MKVKKIILFIFWVAIFVGVIFVVVHAGSARDQMACERYAIHVEVNNTTDTLLYPADIEEIMLHRDSIIGRPYNEIDIYTLEDTLKKHRYVSEINIYGDMLGTLRITATQRVPVVRIINRNNESFYLDETAHAMPVRLGFFANVITVSGNIDMTLEQALSDTLKHKWDGLLSCVKYISNDTFLKNRIGRIHVEDENSCRLIPVTGNHTIIFGMPDQPEKRLERLKLFYQKGMEENYKTIDVRYKSQIVCKR